MRFLESVGLLVAGSKAVQVEAVAGQSLRFSIAVEAGTDFGTVV